MNGNDETDIAGTGAEPGTETGPMKVKGVSPLSILYSFVPYILMSVFAGPQSFRVVTAISLGISAVWMAVGLARGQGVHQLSLVGTVLFAGMLVASFADPHLDAWLQQHSGTMSDAALVVTALAGLAAGHPFTLYYAKLSVDPVQYENNPAFRAGVLAVSRVITGVWALSFAISLGCDFASAATNANALFDWVIPIVAMVGAVKFTMWYPNYSRTKTMAEHPEYLEEHRAIAEAAAARQAAEPA